MNAKTKAAIQKHGENLLAIFGRCQERDPIKLCRKLRKLEREGESLALRLCNGPAFVGGEAESDAIENAIISKVQKILGNEPSRYKHSAPIFLNLDPRGYALKIKGEWLDDRRNYGGFPNDFHRDLGGYGIIAPDLTA